MSIDSAKRVMSGTFGELWWDGELIAECDKFAAKYTQSKEAVNLARQMIEDSKVMGSKGTGSMRLYKVYSRFQQFADAVLEGKDVRSTLVSKLDDPDAYGAERVAVYGVSYDEQVLMDWEAGKAGSMTISFQATNVEYLDKVEA